MRITPDGQITIPPEIREALSISPDVELAFEIEGDKLSTACALRSHLPEENTAYR